MDEKIYYILIAIAFLVIWFFLSLAVSRYKVNYEIKQKKRAEKEQEKKQEKEKWKYSKITFDNPLFLEWLKSYFICFDGNQGSGKTISANLLAHFIYYYELETIKKYYRQYSYLYPDYLKTIENLDEQKILPVFSNNEFIDRETGYKSRTEWRRILEKKIPAIRRVGVILIDELRKEFSKNLTYETKKKDADEELKEIEETLKFLRQKLGMHVIGTEQVQSNFWKALRDAGETIVHCEETIVKVSRFGKFLRSIGNFFLTISPALFTTNLFDLFHKNVFFCDKIVTVLKLLFPSYFSFPYNYYYTKRAFSNWIDEKFTHYKTLVQYKGRHYWLQYTNKDLFKYDTNYFRKEYDEKFEEEEKLKRLQFKENQSV